MKDSKQLPPHYAAGTEHLVVFIVCLLALIVLLVCWASVACIARIV